jgi:hypothetical protein
MQKTVGQNCNKKGYGDSVIFSDANPWCFLVACCSPFQAVFSLMKDEKEYSRLDWEGTCSCNRP